MIFIAEVFPLIKRRVSYTEARSWHEQSDMYTTFYIFNLAGNFIQTTY